MSLLISLGLNEHPVTSIQSGTIVIKEATTGGKVLVLKKGEVEVSIEGKLISKINKPGEIFGEIAAIKGCKYGATITATTDCEFFVIDNLMTYLKRCPDDAIYLLQILCDRLIYMNTHFKIN